MKINLVLALKDRVIRLSHPFFRNKDLITLKNILIENSYPIHLVNKMLFNTINETHNNNNVVQNSNTEINNILQNHNDGNVPDGSINEVGFFSIPYINDLTPKLLSLFNNYKNIKIATKNVKTMYNCFTKTKTKIEKLEQSNLVYKIPCHNCDKTYIGETSQNLSRRLCSHRSDCKIKKRSCALVDHVLDKKHTMNFEDVSILSVEKYQLKRRFLEMVHIKKDNNSINKKSDINKLSNIYNYLLSLQDNPSVRI